MKTYLVVGLVVLVMLALSPSSIAMAHGQPVLALSADVVPAGGEITIAGSEMEPDEKFIITLEGLAGSVRLGEVTATAEGEEGGFTATFTIPADTSPGSYRLRAATETGEGVEADLTVTAPSAQANSGPAQLREPSGELHVLDRTKPIGQTISAVVVIALSLAAGLLLIRSRE